MPEIADVANPDTISSNDDVSYGSDSVVVALPVDVM
jgi:hypothetical protein